MKLAFVHLMRSGGSYAVNKAAAAGVRLHCPWHLGLERDWTRAELFSLARETDGLIHAHSVAWDAETHAFCQANDWRTFTILRDPCEQLVSLWHFCGGPESPDDLDDFILDQLDGKESLKLDYHHWTLPEWWREIDVIVPYEDELHGKLLPRLGLPVPAELPRENARPRVKAASPHALDRVRQSEFYRRYLDALGRA